jgi:phosphatidylserine/phosphatidylglycerophosphate/cardiolipin synthase-like enzyme
MTRPQRVPLQRPTYGLQRHHIIGAGLLASLFAIYQYASQNMLWRNPLAAPTANSSSPASSNTSPPGVPVSYNGNSNPNESQPLNENYLQNGYALQSPSNMQGDIRVYFSPMGGCTDAIVNELNQAQRQILIQAYSFTSEPIAAACIAAHNRGVSVYAVLDRSQETEQYSAADLLINSGITTLIDAQHAIAHNKVILIDGHTLITGSFNFTSNAERSNAENLLIIRNRPDLYSAYEGNLRHHFDHSKQYVARSARSTTKQTGHNH